MAKKRSLPCQPQNLMGLRWTKCTHTSVQKKACWLWIAVDRFGKRFLSVVIGSRDADTGQWVWEEVAHHDINHVMTDYWQPYQAFLPAEIHSQSKAQTFTVEGYNSLFRHFLARLRRKSKCYSTSMLCCSIPLNS
jgi:insertion element IS1 protein InsB